MSNPRLTGPATFSLAAGRVGVLGAALVFLLGLLVTLPNLSGPADRLYPVEGDSAKYDELGRGLANFLRDGPAALGKLAGGLSREDQVRYGVDEFTFPHAPFYGSALGLVYAVSGDDRTAGRALSAVFFAGAGALLFAHARRHFGLVAALLASALFLGWPATLYYGTAIMTEVPMLFCMLLTANALDWTRGSRAPWRVALGGAALGALILSKVTFRMLAPVVVLADLYFAWSSLSGSGSGSKAGPRPGKRGAAGRFLLWRAAGVVAAMLPFWLFLSMGKLSADPLTESGETDLWIYRGNYVPDRGFETVGVGDAWTPELDAASEALRARGEQGKGPLYHEAYERTRSRYPAGWVALLVGKLAWFWTYPAIKTDSAFWFGLLPPPIHWQPIAMVLALAGTAAVLRRRSAACLLAGIAFYVSLVHAATHLVSRYNVPAVAAAFPFAAGCAVELVRAGAAWLRAPRRLLPLWTLIPAVLFGEIALLLGRDGWQAVLPIAPAPAYALSVVFQAAAVGAWGWPLYLLLRSWHGRGAAIASVAVFPGLLTLLLFGLGWNAEDKDRFAARLERPLDRVTQNIQLPADLDWNGVAAAEVQLDLLPSVEHGYALVVRVNGHEAARYRDELPSGEDSFLLDRSIFAAGERYGRVLRSVKRNYEGFVRRRHPHAGLEYYRQWYRVPVDPEWIRGQSEVAIEVELESAPPGTWVEVFGDEVVSQVPRNRQVLAPAIFSNAFDLSNYRFELFASDRLLADSRLIRPLRLESIGGQGQFQRGGRTLSDLAPARGKQSGEYRVRLRLRSAGAWVARGGGETAPRVGWSLAPGPSDRPLRPEEIHRLAVERDTYFDGWRTY